jgi:hypothetical protein
MAKTQRFDDILQEYSSKYDLATLSSPNDRANLDALINNQIIIESLQAKVQELIEDDPVSNIEIIQRLSSSLRDSIERNLQLERALALDRKTRNSSSTESVADYIVSLKQTAQDFLEKRLVKLYCPNCQILLARFSIVHDHSPFELRVKCNQCNNDVISSREERDIFFDIKDSAWRKKYKYSVKQSKESVSLDHDVEDDVVLGEDDEDAQT